MKKTIIFITLIIFLNISLPSYARENLPVVAHSKYFTIHGYKGFDKGSILEKLDYDYFVNPYVVFDDPVSSQESVLARTLDSLYLEVSDILDMHSYNFHIHIKILEDQRSVSDAFRKIFSTGFNERSFYLQEQNTIYISAQDLTLGMLGHEISHAIICHYFVVAPPVKTQEVLCGYVEYTLLKKVGRLPSNN